MDCKKPDPVYEEHLTYPVWIMGRLVERTGKEIKQNTYITLTQWEYECIIQRLNKLEEKVNNENWIRLR